MAWILVSPEIHSTFASLGAQTGDTYQISENCLSHLDTILDKLSTEDRTLRTFRRAIGFGQNIKKDLLPLLIHVKNNEKIVDSTIKILVNLTVPIECLLSTESMSRTDIGRHTIFELNRLLATSKEAFVDARITKAILDHMKQTIEQAEDLNFEQCDSINNCLLLLRNILHIPDITSQSGSSIQNQIIWNLFTQSIDKLILHLISHPQRFEQPGPVTFWGVTMIQLIALMYKDQHVGTLHKLLNLWFEASLSESSEDNESNTSPPPNQGSGDSSPMLTSDPTSDSSDNGGSINSNRMSAHNTSKISTHTDKYGRNAPAVTPTTFKPKGIDVCMKDITERLGNTKDAENSKTTVVNKSPECTSELSDYGYGTQLEKESISTSSNDDEAPHMKPVHQKPPHTGQKTRFKEKNRCIPGQTKSEIRRKKLVKRSKTHIINLKGLMHHMPTDEDISNILKEFTVDFLLKGYSNLVEELHSQLKADSHVQIDTSHFFWLITYFLKFATQLELDLEHVSSVLSYDIFSYLIYEGVNLTELIEVHSSQTGYDVKPYIRQMHLVVTAVREFLQALDMYRKISHLTPEDKQHFLELQMQIASTEQFKCLFVLLIRQFKPTIQNQQYLQDLIVTNHVLLLFLDSVGKLPEFNGIINMNDHLQKFATVEMMHQYGLLLENFQSNGEFVNDCVFTMMHHVGGDLDSIATLFQPTILKTFSQIWETDYNVSDDWSDLIEYVIHKFINTPRQTPLTTNDESIPNEPLPFMTTRLKKEEIDKLFSFFEESQCENDPVSNMISLYAKSGVSTNKETIVKHLHEQKLINRENMYLYTPEEQPISEETEDAEDTNSAKFRMYKNMLINDNCGVYIDALQKTLLDACFVKMKVEHPDLPCKSTYIMEPVFYYCCVQKKSIPIVTWSSEETAVYAMHSFLMLLHTLGFHLPIDTGKIFVRIPEFWTPDVLFNIAMKLGPIQEENLQIDLNLLRSSEFKNPDTLVKVEPHAMNYMMAPISSMQTLTMFRVTPVPNAPRNWLQTVIATNVNQRLPIASITEIPILEKPMEIFVLTKCEKETDLELNPLDDCDDKRILDCKDDDILSPIDNILTNMDTLEHSDILSETASVASDLTRMCVSDEEEK